MQKKLFFNLTILFVLALVFSRFAVTSLMILMSISALYAVYKHEKGIPESWSLASLYNNKAIWGLSLVFIAVVLSGLNSEDKIAWLHQVRVKLPFVFLPMIFFVFKEIKQVHHEVMHRMLLFTMVTSTLWTLFVFFKDHENIQASLGFGKAIPTLIDHIHYGIFLAYSIVSAYIFALTSSDKLNRRVYSILGIYLFLFLHFLAVRTGLVLCYSGLIVVTLWFVIKNKKWTFGALVLTACVLLPFIAYKSIPTLHKKINYMVYDIKQFNKGKGNNYSDSERLMSYNIALELIKEKPWTGHGIGDIRPVMKEKHLELYGQKEKYINPHNQYLFILVSLGFVGSILFFLGAFSPFLFASDRNIFLIVITIMMMLSFLVENTIQRALITAFFLFFTLLNLSVGKLFK